MQEKTGFSLLTSSIHFVIMSHSEVMGSVRTFLFFEDKGLA